MERLDQANIEHLIVSTVSMLCKNSIAYSSELRIQGTIGITVDASSIILVHLNQRCEHGAENSHRSASAYDRRDAADNMQANAYSLADAKRPRMTPVTRCSRRPVGCGYVSVRPVRRVRSGHAAIGALSSAQARARHQPAIPGPSRVALMKPHGGLPHTPVQRLTPSSRHFHAGHVASSIASSNDTPPQLPTKLELEAARPSAVEMKQRPILSDVVYVESDDETDTAVALKPDAVTSRPNAVNVKSEGQSLDALQMIVDRAVVAARESNPGMCEATSSNVIVATASQRSTPSSSGVYIDSMSTGVHHTVAADIKPTVDSTDMAVQQWTPSKILQISPPKPLLSTAAGVKTEVAARSPAYSSMPLHLSSTSKAHSSPAGTSPPASTHKGTSQQNSTSWTSVTETTFICTTAGCSKRFTTKRALVRHQKDKHGLLTRMMRAAGEQMEEDSESASDIL